MNISTVRLRFEALKTLILKDGKVDFEESEVLLDFIEPYVKAKLKNFVVFSEILHKFRTDSTITPEESDVLVNSIECISEMLLIEDNIEKFILYASLGIIVVFLLSLIFS